MALPHLSGGHVHPAAQQSLLRSSESISPTSTDQITHEGLRRGPPPYYVIEVAGQFYQIEPEGALLVAAFNPGDPQALVALGEACKNIVAEVRAAQVTMGATNQPLPDILVPATGASIAFDPDDTNLRSAVTQRNSIKKCLKQLAKACAKLGVNKGKLSLREERPNPRQSAPGQDGFDVLPSLPRDERPLVSPRPAPPTRPIVIVREPTRKKVMVQQADAAEVNLVEEVNRLQNDPPPNVCPSPNPPAVAAASTHEAAKDWLIEQGARVGSTIAFVGASNVPPELRVEKGGADDENLDRHIFGCEDTMGVQDDIRESGANPTVEVTYEVAGQGNGTESPGPFTPRVGAAMKVSENDKTQGPLAQRMFEKQFEVINAAANLGLNMLAPVLQEDSDAMQHGYMMPADKDKLCRVAQRLEEGWRNVLWPRMTAVPDGGTHKVSLCIGAAPAPGYAPQDKDNWNCAEGDNLQYYMARSSFAALLQGGLQNAIARADAGDTRPEIVRPAALGLGVFGCNPEIIGQALKDQCLELQNQLKVYNAERVEGGLAPVELRVLAQIFNHGGGAKNMAVAAGLQKVRRAEAVFLPEVEVGPSGRGDGDEHDANAKVDLPAVSDHLQKQGNAVRFRVENELYVAWHHDSSGSINVQKQQDYAVKNAANKLGVTLDDEHQIGTVWVNGQDNPEKDIPPEWQPVLAQMSALTQGS